MGVARRQSRESAFDLLPQGKSAERYYTSIDDAIESLWNLAYTERYSKAERVKMYRFSMDPRRRLAWITAIRCVGWQPNVHSRKCSAHFVSGLFIKLASYMYLVL